MPATAWIGVLALVASTTFAAAWWLGRRVQAGQLASLRQQLQDVRLQADLDMRSLHQRYERTLGVVAQAAVNVMREQRRTH